MKKISNKLLTEFSYLIGYTCVLSIVALMFKTFTIDNSHFGIYIILSAMLLTLLNKTIKPLLFFLTIPITGITLGLFYPFINLFMLKITDWIMGNHFGLSNIRIAFFIAILISLMNLLVESLIINPLIKRVKDNE